MGDRWTADQVLALAPDASSVKAGHKLAIQTPCFGRDIAAAPSGMGVPAFACTPDAFPELLAVAIGRGDVIGWADANDLSQRGMGQE